MPREQLLGLVGEVDRLLAAGASSASGSEQLQRRGQTLREMGKKVPALNPVADAIDKVKLAPGKQAAPAFLDLLGMTRQVRASLSSAGVAGDLTPLPASGPWQTYGSVRQLFPVQEALDGGGAGRETAVREAIEQEVTSDMRLVGVLLRALNDNYAPMAELVAEKGLVPMGKGIVPELENQLDLQGKTADARRLKLACRVDKAAGLRLCRKAIQEGSVALRVQALECLPDVAEDPAEAERTGLELYKDKKGDVRAAAISALRAGRSDETLETLLSAVKDRDRDVRNHAAEALKALPHAQTTPRLLDLLQQGLTELATDTKPRAKKEEKPAKAKAAGKKKPAAAPKIDKELQEWMNRHQAGLDRTCYLMDVLCSRQDADKVPTALAILPLVESKEPEVRTAALQGLGMLGNVVPEILKVLMEAVEDGNNNIKQAALQGLRAMPPAQREPIFATILDLARKPKMTTQIRHAAGHLLPGHFATHRQEVTDFLREALSSKDAWRMTLAYEMCGQIGPDAHELLPRLLEILKSSGYAHGLIQAIPQVDPDGTLVFPRLTEMLESGKSQQASTALWVAQAYGKKATALIPAIQSFMLRDEGYTTYWAQSVIRQITRA
jgi:HEAT repeat protein